MEPSDSLVARLGDLSLESITDDVVEAINGGQDRTYSKQFILRVASTFRSSIRTNNDWKSIGLEVRAKYVSKDYFTDDYPRFVKALMLGFSAEDLLIYNTAYERKSGMFSSLLLLSNHCYCSHLIIAIAPI